MGHKVNPIGLRLGINRTWDSRWYAGADYSKLLHDDLKLRAHLRKKLAGAGVSRVVIERPAKKPRVTIYAARPGVVIGKKGQDIENLRKDLGKMAKGEVSLNIVEIRKPEIDATLVAENISQQLERRVAFRRAMKRAVQSAMRLGAQGVKVFGHHVGKRASGLQHGVHVGDLALNKLKFANALAKLLAVVDVGHHVVHHRLHDAQRPAA